MADTYFTCDRCDFTPQTPGPISDYRFDGWTVTDDIVLCDDCTLFIGGEWEQCGCHWDDEGWLTYCDHHHAIAHRND